MASEMQLKVLFEKKLNGRLDFKKGKKNNSLSLVFFDVIFYVYTHVDNRERARASDWKQKRQML